VDYEFLVVVLAVVAVPGADFVVTLRNTIAGGARSGAATVLGVSSASLLQGTLVSLGIGAFIVRSQPVFSNIKWLGVAYLLFLAAQALRSAWRGQYDPADHQTGPGQRKRGLRQGFLCNITNPKMFVFYLSLLPQFVGPGASIWSWLGHAWVLPLIGTAWLLVIVVLGGAVREKLLRPVARRIIDTTCGFALLGFSTRLAMQRD